MNFAHGPKWGSHEGGPAWKSALWYLKPKEWTAKAEITCAIGAVEDWLLTAKPTPAEIAILDSSSSDIWTMNNFSYGFDRMHTWLALTHAQTPVDIVPEYEVAEGQLAKYRVCYLSGPAIVAAPAGHGQIISVAFLPSLTCIKPALVACVPMRNAWLRPRSAKPEQQLRTRINRWQRVPSCQKPTRPVRSPSLTKSYCIVRSARGIIPLEFANDS